MKKLFLLLNILIVSSLCYSQLLVENFDYPSGDSLGSHGWVSFSGGSTNVLTVTSPGLVYQGYPQSNIGNASIVRSSGQDAYKDFSSVDSTVAIYVSFMVNVISAQAPATGNYFFALLPSNSTSFYSARFYATDSAGLRFGLSKAASSSGPIVYTANPYNIGTTYLVVIKYQYNPGSDDAESFAYIFSSGIPSTEPTTATIGPVTGTSPDNSIGRIALRQGTASNSPVAQIDGIVVSKTWLNSYNFPGPPILINPLDNSTNVNTTVNFIWSKIDPAIFYILDVATDSTFNNLIVNDTIYIDTSKAVSGFQSDTKYFWRVRASDSSGTIHYSLISNFTTSLPIQTNIKLLFEGMYSPFYNLLIRKDSLKVYLRNASPPFNLLDSTKSIIDSISFTGSFKFQNEETGIYYIVVKHFNSIETWSKIGGQYLTNDGTIFNYDFTISNTQAYGSNLTLKGSKYCLYSGDINKDGYVNLPDIVLINNDASSFAYGNYLVTDLTGDRTVDLTDMSLCYNNASNFVGVIRP